MGFKEVDNSLAFEDVEAFKEINIKHNQKYVNDYKKCVEKEASLLDLAHSIIDYCIYWYLHQKEGILKPILVWKYWKTREAFIEKFKSFFKLEEDYVEQALNFIRIYLESENIEKFNNMYVSVGSKLEDCHVFPSCFCERYIWKNNYDSILTWWLDSLGVSGTMIHYP